VCGKGEDERLFGCVYKEFQSERDGYGVAAISRLLKIIGLFCKRAL